MAIINPNFLILDNDRLFNMTFELENTSTKRKNQTKYRIKLKKLNK